MWRLAMWVTTSRGRGFVEKNVRNAVNNSGKNYCSPQSARNDISCELNSDSTNVMKNKSVEFVRFAIFSGKFLFS